MRSGTAIILSFFSVALVLLASCSKYYGCDEAMECKEKRPEKGRIRFLITPPENGDSLSLEVRDGTWKNGTTIHSQTVKQERIGIEADVQKRYTAELTYPSEGDTLRAYDSGRLDLEDLKNCGEVCYKLDTLELNLRRADR